MTRIATSFCDETFTLPELRRVYEAVWDAEIDNRNFQRKVGAPVGSEAGMRRPSGRGGGWPGPPGRAECHPSFSVDSRRPTEHDGGGHPPR
ncbi:NrtR DNA-binding winged helix domain-containing protein [Propioniciclava sinopodophylli]|uniref:NrtR DNA-binding winged helix domain-containing protein n=1 Tax=Propioniciclava sinopodophylli TaxID=1837344 RepID=UPI003CD0CCC9